MKRRIKEILSWYGGDNTGTLTNLARILNHGKLGGTGKLVILPVDQGVEHGPGRPSVPNPPVVHVVTPTLMVRSNAAARTSSVVVLTIA